MDDVLQLEVRYYSIPQEHISAPSYSLKLLKLSTEDATRPDTLDNDEVTRVLSHISDIITTSQWDGCRNH